MNEMSTVAQSTELVVESMTAPVLSSSHIQARVNMIQAAIKQIFIKDVHFGIIPGTPKPTLYKPGAEQLLVMFRIAPSDPKIEDLSTADCIRYRVTRGGLSQIDGRFLGAGCGECSSDAEKYKWRRPVCDAEWDETPADRRREVWRKVQGKPMKLKSVRTNPADVANTILKMADKRAFVAMTLLVTGASDAFAQDIEDLPEEVRESVVEETGKPLVQSPARASASAAAPSTAGRETKTFIPKGVQDRVGKGPFKIESPDGILFNTFDEGLADMARDAVMQKLTVVVECEQTKFGLDIKRMTTMPDSAEAVPA